MMLGGNFPGKTRTITTAIALETSKGDLALALALGIVLIMLGNGMHFTLIGLRGGIEGFSAAELAIVTSGYFLGFLSGARLTPGLIQRVGHVRVFAALASFISAVLILYPVVWILLLPFRLFVGAFNSNRGNIHGRIKAKGSIGERQIVIDGFGNTDDRSAAFKQFFRDH